MEIVEYIDEQGKFWLDDADCAIWISLQFAPSSDTKPNNKTVTTTTTTTTAVIALCDSRSMNKE